MRKNNIFIVYGGLLLSSLSLSVTAEQTCNNQIAETTPTSQFEIHGNGTVTDNKTRLMWKQCLEGVSGDNCATGSAIEVHWDVALQTAETLNVGDGYANHTDWRLPNVKELLSIVEQSCYSPAINLNVFPGLISDHAWSGSPSAVNSGYTWYVSFPEGYSYNHFRSYDKSVRLVRSVQ